MFEEVFITERCVPFIYTVEDAEIMEPNISTLLSEMRPACHSSLLLFFRLFIICSAYYKDYIRPKTILWWFVSVNCANTLGRYEMKVRVEWSDLIVQTMVSYLDYLLQTLSIFLVVQDLVD